MRKNLFAFRKSLNKTQTEMANIIGLESATYGKIEKGKTNPKYETMKKFEKTFPEQDIWYIFTDYNPLTLKKL